MRLRDGVVPSIFEAFPAYLQKNTRKRKPPKSCPVCDPSPQELAQEAAVFTLDVPENPMESTSSESPTKAQLKRKLVETETQLTKSRKKNKSVASENKTIEEKKC